MWPRMNFSDSFLLNCGLFSRHKLENIKCLSNCKKDVKLYIIDYGTASRLDLCGVKKVRLSTGEPEYVAPQRCWNTNESVSIPIICGPSVLLPTFCKWVILKLFYYPTCYHDIIISCFLLLDWAAGTHLRAEITPRLWRILHGPGWDLIKIPFVIFLNREKILSDGCWTKTKSKSNILRLEERNEWKSFIFYLQILYLWLFFFFSKRMTIHQSLNHPWLTGNRSKKSVLFHEMSMKSHFHSLPASILRPRQILNILKRSRFDNS